MLLKISPIRQQAFTLIELIVTFIIIAVVATLASVRYSLSIGQAYEQDLLTQLRIINSVLEVERRTTGNYPTTNTSDTGPAAINAELDLEIPASSYYNSYIYTYIPPGGPGSGSYTLRVGTVKGWAITYSRSGDSYVCSAGTCPTCLATGCP